MDVDSDNFEEASALLLERLKSCAFVALDMEMTGIRVDGLTDDLQDLPEERYKKSRQAAAMYGLVQVGVCPFEASGDGSGKPGSYVARPFNFFIFPRPVNEPPDCYIAPKITLDADAVHFVRCNNIDFGRWLAKGIPYLDRLNEDALKNALAKRVATEDKHPTDDFARNEAKDIEDRSGGFGPGSSAGLGGRSAKVQQAILQAMRERRKGDKIVLERRPGPLGGCRPPVATLRNLGPDAAALQNWLRQEKQDSDRYLSEQVGFRRVWKALLKAGRPLVMHNGLLDLLYAYQWLEEPLPPTLAGFEGILEKTMPSGTKVFDTKWIAGFTDVGQSLGLQQKSGLEGLCEALNRVAPGAAPSVTFPNGFDKYSESGRTSYHEAGYDAYCTGRLFAYFCSSAQYSLGAPVTPEPVIKHVAPAKLRVMEKAAPKKKAVVQNRFAALDSEDESDEEDEDEEEDDQQEEEDDASAGPPPRPTLAGASNRVFLMNSAWDISWGSHASTLPIRFAAEGRRVAVRYLYSLRKGATPQEVIKSVQQAWQQVGPSDARSPVLEVRWSGKDVGYALLAPRERTDDHAWQDPEKLADALDATLKKASSAGGGGPAFEWGEDRAKAFDAGLPKASAA